jgi:hypothetical protein
MAPTTYINMSAADFVASRGELTKYISFQFGTINPFTCLSLYESSALRIFDKLFMLSQNDVLSGCSSRVHNMEVRRIHAGEIQASTKLRI